MWTWIWVGLIVFALCWWGFVLWRFYLTARDTYRDVDAAIQRWAPLAEVEAVTLEPVQPQILDDEALAEQFAGLRERKAAKRSRRRQRRLKAQSRWVNYPAGRSGDQL